MSRLPLPGKDVGIWGDVLNDFLSVSHKSDGMLKDSIVGDAAVSAISQAKVTGLSASLAATEQQANKGVANGYASLDATGRVPLSQLQSAAQLASFAESGVLVAQPGLLRFRFPFAATISGVTAAVNVAPTGQAILVDVNKNGGTIFTTQANRPSIAAGANATSSTAVPDETSFVAGDYMTIDIDQIGSGVAGSDLTVFIVYNPV